MWQRTALNVCRASDSPIRMKGLLLPSWQNIVSIPVWILKGVLLVLMFIYMKWYIPVIVFLIDSTLTPILPIPHSYFLDKMEKRLRNPNLRLLKKEYQNENDNLKDELLSAVLETRGRYQV